MCIRDSRKTVLFPINGKPQQQIGNCVSTITGGLILCELTGKRELAGGGLRLVEVALHAAKVHTKFDGVPAMDQDHGIGNLEGVIGDQFRNIGWTAHAVGKAVSGEIKQG